MDVVQLDQGIVRERKPLSWRIAPDPERLASEWWDHARASKDAPQVILPLLRPLPLDEIVVTESEAVAIRRWAFRLPGWEITGSHNTTLIIEPAPH